MSQQPARRPSSLGSSPSGDLNPFEAQLADLIPAAARVDRDEIMFQSGLATAARQYRRTARRWQAACGLLLCLTIGQWALQGSPGVVDRQVADQAISQTETTEPESEAMPSPAAELENTDSENTPPEDPSPKDTPPTEKSPAGPPSVSPRPWPSTYFAGRYHSGRGLSVGSPPSAVWNDPPIRTRRSSTPPSPPQTSRELLSEWLNK